MAGKCHGCRRDVDCRNAVVHLEAECGAVIRLDLRICGECAGRLLFVGSVLDLELGFPEGDGLLAPG
jgi:hypothetical protein